MSNVSLSREPAWASIVPNRRCKNMISARRSGTGIYQWRRVRGVAFNKLTGWFNTVNFIEYFCVIRKLRLWLGIGLCTIQNDTMQMSGTLLSIVQRKLQHFMAVICSIITDFGEVEWLCDSLRNFRQKIVLFR